VHQTAIIMIAHALQGSDLPAWLEAGIVIAGTIGACMLTYEFVRRVPILRPLFGLRAVSAEPAMAVRVIIEPAQ
jgi:peptidoglycan/LPS O-acetylase OafA/YrhL